MVRLLKPNRHPVGATSLLIVTGISLVLVSIVVGLTALSVREARQALDTDLSNRALAAAEASVKDASEWISNNPGQQYPNCNKDDGNSQYYPDPEDQNIQIVCRTVTTTTPKVEMQVKRDQATQIFTYLQQDSGTDDSPTPPPAPPPTAVTTMSLQWSKLENEPLVDISNLYGSSVDWPISAPAAIELTVVSWSKVPGQPPSTVSSLEANRPDGLAINTRLIVPSTVPKFGVVGGTQQDVSATGSSCTQSANSQGYYCSATVDLGAIISTAPENSNIIVQIKSRYKDADILAEFTGQGTTAPVVVTPSKAVIDVTARVGNFYRRLRAQKAISGSSFITDALYSSKNICKDLTVRENFALEQPNTCN